MVETNLNARLKQVLTFQGRPQTRSIEEGNLKDRWNDAIEDVLSEFLNNVSFRAGSFLHDIRKNFIDGYSGGGTSLTSTQKR